ncbi:MAG: DUF4280 domain-containing protein [Lachnospiraceae bacterium]|nr:DUF4280 domain-containing protein [Lachnospiraceae bacterium]
MSELVTMGGQCVCSMGLAPAPIRVSSQQSVVNAGKPIATIQDATPGNIGPFGMCTSLANPAVAAATAAALGVLTPQPCTPVPAGTWIPTKPAVLVNGKPCLCSDCKMMCSYGGSISVVSPGQATVSAK